MYSSSLGSHGAGVHYLADGNGSLTEALGLGMDFFGRGLGRRSRRYVAVVDNGVARAVMIEPDPNVLEVTSADHALKRLHELFGR